MKPEYKTYKTQLLPVGQNFDSIFESFSKNLVNADKQYPPYNVYKENEQEFIEIACTGLSKEDIKAYFDDEGLLTVSGEYPDTEREYYHSGLSRKNFKRKFLLEKYFKVKSIKVENGLCTVELYKDKPETEFLEIK